MAHNTSGEAYPYKRKQTRAYVQRGLQLPPPLQLCLDPTRTPGDREPVWEVGSGRQEVGDGRERNEPDASTTHEAPTSFSSRLETGAEQRCPRTELGDDL